MLLQILSALQLALGTPALSFGANAATQLHPEASKAAQRSAGPGEALVYRGRAHQLDVRIPAFDEDISIDGSLSDSVWSRAAVLTDFSEYQPVDGLPADDPTEVLVWYSPHAIYFGIRAREVHGVVHATLADRDRIDGDDYVQILLDTFHDGRRAFVFGVNPLGVQADGIRSEGGGNAGHAFAGNGSMDLSPDFVYESKGHLTRDGYQVEVRIPFKSLRYQSAPVQSWGINIIRQVQHSGYQLTWTPARRASSSFLAQSGTLEGLTGLKRGLVLDMNPVATAKIAGAQPVAGNGRWRYDTSPEIGGNLRWGVTPNLSLAATANPDFSQVEADADQIVSDPREALYYAEKRPFFLEGIEQFETPKQLIYTRRIVSPIAAAKLTGKEAGTDVGVLSAVDQVTGDDGRTHHPLYNLVRLRRDLGDRSTLGLVYTDRSDGGSFNRVLGADSRIYFKRLYFAEFTAAGSATRDSLGGVTRAAPLWEAVLDRTGRNWGFHYVLEGSHPDFQTQSGFLDRTGIAHFQFMNRVSAYGSHGATLENFTTFISLDNTWEYEHFTAGRIPDDIRLDFRSSFTLRGGWGIGADPYIESISFPGRLYTGYAIVRPAGTVVDTVGFDGTGRLRDFGLKLSLNTPRWKRFSGSVSLTAGRDANFDEWAPAWIEVADLSADWRPTGRVRVEPSFIHQRYIRRSDGSTESVRRIPRLKLEYQLSRAIFFRFVGQYDSQWRDSLRDDSRTGDPIIVRDADGVYQATSPWSSNAFRHDWLFSYQPTPGTVIFAGYGSSLDAAAFTLHGLDRQSDGFFFKVSYLFRM